MNNSHEYITKTEIAERFHVTPRTVEAWMAKRIIPFQKIGRTVRFHWPTVVAFVNSESAKYFAPDTSGVRNSKKLFEKLAESVRLANRGR